MTDPGRAIANQISLYSRYFDAGDMAAYAALFEHGRHAWIPEEEGTGPEPILRFIEKNVILYDGVPNTQHAVSTLTVDVDEPRGAAVATSHVTIFQAAVDFPLQPIFCGRYHDTFELVDGRWHWTLRAAEADLVGDMSRHLYEPLASGPYRT